MLEDLISVLDNVIYLDIETTGLDETCSEIIEIGAVKVKDGVITTYNTLIRPRGRVPISIYSLCSDLKEADLLSARSLNSIKQEVLEFLEDLPLICHNANFERKFLSFYIPEIKNTIMDSMELAIILEPWRKEYNLNSLIKEITNLNKDELHRGLSDSIDTLKVVNSLLLRQWNREENSRKKNKSLHNLIVKEYQHLQKWPWTKHLLKPPFFIEEGYTYVNYLENKEEELNLKKIPIDYLKYEDLLENEEIWNNGGDFGYQYRKDQKEFAKKIRENFEKGERIFIEAPTGSGKTFAYVIIAAIETYLNKQKNRKDDASFIISTNTKELQNQLIERDIPTILKKLRLDDKLNYGAMKGKGNYLCIERINKCEEFQMDEKGNLALLFLRRLCENGNYGDIENINYLVQKHLELDKYIREVNCDSEQCKLDKCTRACFLRKRYNELPEENITVINHSLLACWPYTEKKKINHIIIDEGHNLMEKCYDFFAEEFSSAEFIQLLDLIDKGHPSIIAMLLTLNASFGYRETIEKDKIMYLVNDIIVNINILLNDFRSLRLISGEYNFTTEFFLPREDLKGITKAIGSEISVLKESIYPLYKMLNDYIYNITLDDEIDGDNDHKNLSDYIAKLKGAFDVLDKFLESSVFYAKILEVDSEYKSFTLKNVPLNVGELVNEHMLKDVKSTTFLSATLRIENSFNKMKKHLGQEKAKEFIIPPTFDLKKRTKIFALKDVGRYDEPSYIKNVSKFIYNTALKINGHILVLFNNNARRTAVSEELELLTRGTKIEVHMSKKSVRALNDKNRQVIILGSKGFFEGIDVPGDALSCVMLDKIPNYSPEYPILRAITTYQKKGYQDVNYPQVCIKAKQIYGRLIRSTFDYGYFIILDPGQNSYTIRNLERDLNGPSIEFSTTTKVLSEMEFDYNNWRRNNINIIINNIKKNNRSIEDEFNNEAKKHKLFWELLKVENGMYYFENINFKLNGKI
ncbi:exonuclease [Clostridium sp. 2-1]|uniref:helicase C-terminal domain-containing protein n=1 Tax=Clostridium TaxID=1485 RepID=UPI000CDB30DA|nr:MULTISPECIES: helicase C-terminal domain-containing protein [Clostridium]MBN7575761.1 DEAD/DEAH box helicase [Clostridium beijerinckii]MBN7580893.1 DEAD/DEAH box helicase [Clostridium beijerinckii]MBN7585537.1 DEAD/DEAH box helicase [Clostridium beijerinckii]MBO0521146.1 DEAD/DEAH box helicase [Clostridium beijerinckii]POO91240.1 exonuclease [Clostridium sp. 2-1]